MELDLIYTEEYMVVSRQHQEWRYWQNKFANYKASLSFNSIYELIDFLRAMNNYGTITEEMRKKLSPGFI